MKTVGVLALQGAYHAHQKKIQSLGYECILIKTLAELESVDALILPGGESTAMSYLLKKDGLWERLQKRVLEVPVLATCAGVILLQSLGAFDIDVIRNGYGPQLASGIFPLESCVDGKAIRLDGFFIRAPIIDRIKDDSITTLASYQNKPVLIQKNKMIAATFHPELSDSSFVHKLFCQQFKVSS
ncbi:pyridoxal 5'-phosphate synthase glutaminase subunit PdxT [Fangia hongkongensis]|uniref:pyridoxal 5'-phosphate synthase glutaminase subunit PdxT n=1 Tax=Fangia hongkongensis TaxID=270495 RepID=UPI0003794DD3|nr:pyridoxal 5'-phosphate synthase glutaminase subunit PdxT [Fangia hongkongensis]MBK2123901.1 pyridoxal 5'-phosphate synthase glutaminase subunit PdxT [Fangia hongkongensis]